jgi:hypothetical protein
MMAIEGVRNMYTFIRDNQEYQTENLSQFCREHNLRRSHIAEVNAGMRKSYKGWSKADPTIPASNDDYAEALEQEVLEPAMIAARASGDPEYQALVQGRVDKLRKGEALKISTGNGKVGIIDE